MGTQAQAGKCSRDSQQGLVNCGCLSAVTHQTTIPLSVKCLFIGSFLCIFIPYKMDLTLYHIR